MQAEKPFLSSRCKGAASAVADRFDQSNLDCLPCFSLKASTFPVKDAALLPLLPTAFSRWSATYGS